MSAIAYAEPAPYWRYASGRPILRLVLALALALHALMLLIPGKRPSLPAARAPLAVQIEQRLTPQPAPLAEPLPKPIEPAPVQTEMPRAVESPPPPQPVEATPPPEAPMAVRPPVSTALLLEQARNRDWRSEKPATRTPGVAVIPDLPPNLVRPVLPLEPTVFTEHYISGEQELLDQWMDPGGAVNAVVRLPNGQVVCGRAAAWDPMNPLFEPVAMYRSCGGGGRRKPSAASPFSTRE